MNTSMTVATNHTIQPAIFLPTLGKVEHRLKIMRHHNPESPREWDNLGTMYCEHNRYTLGDKKAGDIRMYNERTDRDELPAKGYTILPLYLYDHSGITMNTTGFSCGWDSGCVGYIYISDEKAKREFSWKIITEKRREKLRECLREEVKVYDQYLTGDCYGFKYESFVVYDDGREESQDDEDSVWGFFGRDLVDNSIEDYLPVKLADCEVEWV